ncbi:DUF1987 domain-containing protein [Parvicella tangerina]|uniref:SiaC family regulatory phosphoprotein domain-containing protein n=1 Tax=Parvicella tangerina TaxID=2829795 RepID=A0A916NBE2_9FLAO|nr:DUF1987 domain-containing protein [Parvicella tangerina]CAG5080724.1 hypothetical protein CRYO30217_01428 [Parvicella tangerina]
MAVQINQTDKTPFVHLCSENAQFIFDGIILPEDAVEFFSPITKYIGSYLENPPAESEIICKLEYFNTSASRMLFAMFKAFQDAQHLTKTKVTWYYDEDDDAMEEVAEEFQEILPDLNFVKTPKAFDDLPDLRKLVPVEEG